MSQDSVVRNGQCSVAFWKHIHELYDKNKPCGFKPSQDLELKWSLNKLFKHKVSKFIGMYQQIVGLNQLRKTLENILRDALELCREKSSKGIEFLYLYCWYLVENVPRWDQGLTHIVACTMLLNKLFLGCEVQSKLKQMDTRAPPPTKMPPACGNACYGGGHRPQGNRFTKEDLKRLKVDKAA